MIFPNRFRSKPERRKCAILALGLLLATPCAHAGYTTATGNVPEPAREFRAAWIACVHNYDWPSKPGLPAATQKAELIAYLDKAVELNLNAIILQVRPACDALYASSLEPWTPFLTGKMGQSPGYDPLAFAISEAHRRGLELHAWFNPFRAAAGKHAASSTHVTKTQPQHIRPYGGQKWLDPGEPWVRQHALAVIRDVVTRYDVDGAHIDDYFYPYPNKELAQPPAFPDDVTFAKYGGGQARSDWRRANINTFVKAFHQVVKVAKPQVKVGISPFGIWRPNVPEGIIARLDAYEDIAADSRHWLHQGWCDYFSPQLYWRDQPHDQSFSALLKWWHQQNTQKRHLWPGIATERIDSTADPGRPAEEILKQIEISRTLAPAAVPGHSHWSFKALARNRGGVAKMLKEKLYLQKALVPACPWLGKAPEITPTLRATIKAQGVLLNWAASVSPRRWVIQIHQGGLWTTAAILPGSATSHTLTTQPEKIALRALSASGMLGPPVLMAR